MNSNKNLSLFNEGRVRNLIKSKIDQFNLDLGGMTVVTEAASNYFVVTPIIAAMAGAKVFAISKDSVHGNSNSIIEFHNNFSEYCGVTDKIEYCTYLDETILSKANIITNSGLLRPIDKKVIDMLNSKAVIPLMYEPWEIRKGEIDIEYCKSKNILVMGTDEHHPESQIFEYVGPLSLKMILEADIEINNCKIAIVGSNKFSTTITNYLSKFNCDIQNLENLIDKKNRIKLRDADALILTDLLIEKNVIGPNNGDMLASDLKSFSESICVIQFTGGADVSVLEENGISFYPRHQVDIHRMGMTLADLGPQAVIDLHTAGLKVGEVMARARLSGKNMINSVKLALKTSPAIEII